MKIDKAFLTRVSRWGGGIATFLGFSAVVLVLVLWLAGKFEPKVPSDVKPMAAEGAEFKGRVVAARARVLPRSETATGTIRAVHETNIGSKLLARVTEVNLKAGQKVRADEVLVRLDDTDLQAKLQQAKAAVSAAEAHRAQAATDEQRYARLVESRAVSRQDYEKTATGLRAADADLRKAKETVNEVQAMLDWATVRAPMEGTVIDKKVDVGDTVTPGQLLLTLFDPKRMQLVASVRESLAYQLQVGQEIGVRIPNLNKQCKGTISEIVPEAQSASRTFQVKVTGPCPPGIYSGMFGRLVIPLEEEQVLVIPRAAVRHVGQLELVDVVESGQTARRAVRTGRQIDDDVEVLSGLREGEQVLVRAEDRHE